MNLNSRLDEIIRKVEAGEPIDYQRELALQSLDLVRDSELLLIDTLKWHEEQDAKIGEYFAPQ